MVTAWKQDSFGSMVATWWIVTFLHSAGKVHPEKDVSAMTLYSQQVTNMEGRGSQHLIIII